MILWLRVRQASLSQSSLQLPENFKWYRIRFLSTFLAFFTNFFRLGSFLLRLPFFVKKHVVPMTAVRRICGLVIIKQFYVKSYRHKTRYFLFGVFIYFYQRQLLSEIIVKEPNKSHEIFWWKQAPVFPNYAICLFAIIQFLWIKIIEK